MDDPLVSEVLDRLDRDDGMTYESESLVLGALEGRLSDVIDGATFERPKPGAAGQEPVPVRAYLESVAVTGFRGIGPTCTLRLHPGPGLTLVAGRNGSGKSSIAEAAELTLTGNSVRWLGKSLEWKRGWRNLHTENNSVITVGLRVDGERQPRTVRVTWASDELESSETVVTVPGSGQEDLDSLGWSAALKTFRPFLSYSELSTIIEGKPVDRYNALAPMLGMESLRTPLADLREARLSAENQAKTSKQHVEATIGALRDFPDDRARAAIDALEDSWDLAKIDELITGTEPTSAERERVLAALEQLAAPDLDRVAAAASGLRESVDRLAALQGSDAARALKLAELLQAAVEVHAQHGDGDCPVCGRVEGLHAGRVADMQQEIGRLRSEAHTVDAAQEASHESRRAARSVIGAIPEAVGMAAHVDVGIDLADLQAAWSDWIDVPQADAELAEHLDSVCLRVVEATEAIRSTAAERRQQLADTWRPMAEVLTSMLPVARAGESAAERVGPLKSAEQWLKNCEKKIRDERFETVKERVKEVWAKLAVSSNVVLEDVRLGAKNVTMDVTVDGDRSAALGVMSQGELYALALSLFIPRVRSNDTLFGFVMLDDPVQAMDPVRVERLASVLGELAQTHQVVVFTHDNRLPAAINQHQIPATTVEVTRRPRSEVELKQSLNPVRAAIRDARAVEYDDDLPDEVRRRVVPGFCRKAIEVACLESGRRRLLAQGMSHKECEAVWDNAVRLMPRIAIAFYGNADRAGDVKNRLNNKFGPWASATVSECNRATHTGADEGTDLRDLIRRAEDLAQRLAAS